MHQARNERFYVRGCDRQNETEAKCRREAIFSLILSKVLIGGLILFCVTKRTLEFWVYAHEISFNSVENDGEKFATVLDKSSTEFHFRKYYCKL